MDRDEALRLLTGGPGGIAEWNRRRTAGAELPDLSQADLSRADLFRADLSRVNLAGADLAGALLIGAILVGADLAGADLTGARCAGTVLTDVDLSEVQGLESVHHLGPSPVSTDTLIRSKGKIPEAFLWGCGVPEQSIEYLPPLVGRGEMGGWFERLMALNGETFGAGQYEAAYHALMAALHLAETQGDDARLLSLARVAAEQGHSIDTLDPPHRLSSQFELAARRASVRARLVQLRGS